MFTKLNSCLFFNYISPFLDEAMDSSLIKMNVFLSKKFIKDSSYLFLGFQGFTLQKPSKGPEELEIGWQGQGNREDGVRLGSQGLRGFPWPPSLCGVPRCREGGMAGIATSSFRKVGANSPSRWSIGGCRGLH